MKRTFIIGEEWLYYKIYCGAKTADLLLTEQIKPLIDKFLKEKLIEKWFFIRYSDPDPHIRLRFHFNNLSNIAVVIDSLKLVLVPLMDNNSIHNIQMDTYQRELERYGKNTINLAEQLFYNDSQCILNALDHIEDENLLILFVLKSMGNLLQNFEFSDERKLAFATEQMTYFKKEFNANKTLNKQLDKKYRERRTDIETFLLDKNTDTSLYNILQLKCKVDIKVINQLLVYDKNANLKITLDNLIGSLMHMSVNRSFRSKQRLYELLCYDFLVRFYKMKVAKVKYKSLNTKQNR
jgi:thiopeptide-type bacteriocin biosynthesis protein